MENQQVRMMMIASFMSLVAIGVSQAQLPIAPSKQSIIPQIYASLEIEYIEMPMKKGVKVTKFYKNSVFKDAGGKVGDVIVQIGKTEITKAAEYNKLIRESKTGDVVEVTVMRMSFVRDEPAEFETKVLKVKLGFEAARRIPPPLVTTPLPPDAVIPPTASDDVLAPGQIKMEFATLGVKFVYNNKEAAKIIDFEENSPFKKSGGKIGDIITKIGDKKIKHGYDLIGDLTTRKPGEEVKVEVNRDGKIEILTVTLGRKVQIFGTGVVDPNNSVPPFVPLPPLPPLPRRPVPLPN